MSSAQHIDAQPFYLCHYIHTAVTFGQPTSSSANRAWIQAGALLSDAYTTLIEWLRSRLVGYPFAGAPHLSPISYWTGLNVSMTVPWIPELTAAGLQDRSTPPVIPVLSVSPEDQLSAGTQLARALEASTIATSLATTWRALSEADKTQIANARTAIDQAQYPQREGQTLGDEDFRQLAWARVQLDLAVKPLTGGAKTYTDALTAADKYIQQIAALFSFLVFYQAIRTLDAISLVEQIHGSDGWYTVQSDRYAFPPIRQFEILAFDHPYPKGLMMVEGITEQLPFGPHDGRVIVHGPVLADSAGLNLN